MAVRAYLSDVSPWWTMERQEAKLAEAIPDWPNGVMIYRDPLDCRQRRAHRAESLSARTQMLRPTTRRSQDTVIVASLAVLAWDERDFTAFLEEIRARGWSLISAEDGDISPSGWKAARTKSRLEGASRRGAAVSAERRKAVSKATIDTHIRPYWHLPSRQHPTKDLLEAAGGIALNTVKAHLGPRPIAQWKYQQSLKRKAARAAKETT